MACFAVALCSSNWYVPTSTLSTSIPKPEVALACGSASMSKTFFSKTPNEAAKFTEVVVLPTPPFWFAIAIILPINLLEILAVKSTINYVDRKSFLLTGSKQ
jgi:hypothetical protein